MHRNASGDFHCPVLFKQFTDKSHIVAVRTTGNVFSFEAVEQLNLKAKNWKELLTDEAFTRQDLITIQDPAHLEKFNIANFYHVKHDQKIENEGKLCFLPTSGLIFNSPPPPRIGESTNRSSGAVEISQC